MKSKILAFLLFFIVFTSMAARMTIISYGVPHRYNIKPTDQISCDPTGLFLIITNPGSPQPVVTKYYLGYSNSVIFDTAGGPFTSFNINSLDNSTATMDFNSIDSVVFTPSVDSTGDDDGDGLSNYLEMMLYHTDPQKSSTTGDGISDKWKSTHQSKGMLIANLPMLSVTLAKFPQVWLTTTLDSSSSVENTISNSSDWGSGEESSSTSTGTLTSSHGIEVGLAVENGFEIGLDSKFTFKLTSTQNWSHSWQNEISHEVSSSRQISYNRSLSQTQSMLNSAGKTISGGKITAMLNLKNTGPIGFTMDDPQFTLYGINFVKSGLKVVPICNLASVTGGTFSINPNATAVAGVEGNLTLDEVNYIGSFQFLKVLCTSENISYDPTLSGTQINFSDITTNVKASTAQIIVDFDNELPGQESPMSRYVATLNKYNPANPSLNGTARCTWERYFLKWD